LIGNDLAIYARYALMAYFVGSIPFGWLVGRLFFRKDIRAGGSGNIGATNALRQFGTTTGLIVLALDIAKGLFIGIFARHIFATGDIGIPLMGLMVIIGHVLPVTLMFKGGKGVATAGGVFIALTPIPVLICLAVFIVVTSLTRYVSLGSMIAAVGLFVALLAFQAAKQSYDLPLLVFTALVVLLIIWKHRANISRLLKGTENKLSFTRKGAR